MNKYITAYYLDEGKLLKGVKQIKSKGVKIKDVLSPFPVHGLDKALGLRRSRLARVAFAGGAIGAIAGFGFQTWVFTSAYPIDFGGKPYFSAPSFIPVTFETTVLFSAFSMVFAFLIASKLLPGENPVILDERVTDDHFLVVIELDEESTEESIKEIEKALKEAGAEGIIIKA